MKKSDRRLALGKQISLRRTEEGMSLGEVARNAGNVNTSTLSRIEAGLTDPSLATLCILAPVLCCEFRIEPNQEPYLVPLGGG